MGSGGKRVTTLPPNRPDVLSASTAERTKSREGLGLVSVIVLVGDLMPTHYSRVGYSVGRFGFGGVSVIGFWFGDGRSGTLMQDDYGIYADTCDIGGCPAVFPTHALGDLPVSRASLGGAIRPA